MTDAIRTFFKAWGESDAATRTDLIGGAMAETFFYVDPNTPEPITSIDALTGYVAMFTENMPGGSVEVVHLSDTAGHARATLDFMRGDTAMMRGQYFGEMDDSGRLAKLVGFIGQGEPE